MVLILDFDFCQNFGGPERIRTAVEAFAELCLATRPKDPLLLFWATKSRNGCENKAKKGILKF